MTEKYVVTEEDFYKAYNNAGPYARRRLNRKMSKKKHRSGQYLPPADLEQYVTNFVLTHKDK